MIKKVTSIPSVHFFGGELDRSVLVQRYDNRWFKVSQTKNCSQKIKFIFLRIIVKYTADQNVSV